MSASGEEIAVRKHGLDIRLKTIGVLGCYRKQASQDSGAGATLGSFEGRVAALGGTASYDFVVNEIPVSTRIKVFREFAERNRLGDATVGFLTVAMPLWSPEPPPQ